jgi:hypothetical protein
VRYLKDNTLLPRGFDTSFDGGGDLVRFEVPVPSGRQYAVEVALRYQSMDIGGSGTSKGSTP